jgi:hypothetical protein
MPKRAPIEYAFGIIQQFGANAPLQEIVRVKKAVISDWNKLSAVEAGEGLEEKLLIMVMGIILVQLSDLPNYDKKEVRSLVWQYGEKKGKEVGNDSLRSIWEYGTRLADSMRGGEAYAAWKELEEVLYERIKSNESFKEKFKRRCVPS